MSDAPRFKSRKQATKFKGGHKNDRPYVKGGKPQQQNRKAA